MASVTPRERRSKFTRSDLQGAVTREFCAECGTHLVTRRPGLPAAILKAGTLDDPGLYGGPQMAIFTIDSQAFHHIPDGRASNGCRSGRSWFKIDDTRFVAYKPHMPTVTRTGYQSPRENRAEN
jgi:hypothetical protein